MTLYHRIMNSHEEITHRIKCLINHALTVIVDPDYQLDGFQAIKSLRNLLRIQQEFIQTNNSIDVKTAVKHCLSLDLALNDLYGLDAITREQALDTWSSFMESLPDDILDHHSMRNRYKPIEKMFDKKKYVSHKTKELSSLSLLMIKRADFSDLKIDDLHLAADYLDLIARGSVIVSFIANDSVNTNWINQLHRIHIMEERQVIDLLDLISMSIMLSVDGDNQPNMLQLLMMNIENMESNGILTIEREEIMMKVTRKFIMEKRDDMIDWDILHEIVMAPDSVDMPINLIAEIVSKEHTFELKTFSPSQSELHQKAVLKFAVRPPRNE